MSILYSTGRTRTRRGGIETVFLLIVILAVVSLLFMFWAVHNDMKENQERDREILLMTQNPGRYQEEDL